MFDIDSKNRRSSVLPVITDNYRVLHFDEYPILFSGTNRYHNKLIGSLAYEDTDNDTFRYFVIIIDDTQYLDFTQRKKTYLDLIKEAGEVFVIDRDINEKILATYCLELSDIPTEYLPLANSYIPELKTAQSFNYSFSLKGKLADYHKALVSDINSVSQRIYDFLRDSLDIIDDLPLQPSIYSQPSLPGSYRLNFDIEFKSDRQVQLFQIDESKISAFLNNYLNYIAYVLPEEEEDFLEGEPEESQGFQLIISTLNSIYDDAHLKLSPAINDKLINCINNSAIKLSDVTDYLKSSESFDKIELSQYSSGQLERSIGLLTEDYKESVSSKLLEEEIYSETKEIEVDDQPKEYRILVKALSIDSGVGRAWLFYEDENYSLVRLKIEKGDKELLHSIYTKGLDEGKVISVKGVATKINSNYKRLICIL